MDPSGENLDRMEKALASLGIGCAAEVRTHFAKDAAAQWRWADGLDDHYVDLLTTALPYSFIDVDADAVEVEHEGLRLRVISREKLIGSKKASMVDPKRPQEKRLQDAEDLLRLEVQ